MDLLYYLINFQAATSHLLSKLPLDSTVLQQCQYLDPRKRQEAESLNAISDLTSKLIKPLKNVLRGLFPGCTTEENVVDAVKSQWQEHKLEIIPDLFFVLEETSKSGRKQFSYWEHAFDVAGIHNEADPSPSLNLDVDKFIVSFEN